jgi:elongation factor P hydroxylase
MDGKHTFLIHVDVISLFFVIERRHRSVVWTLPSAVGFPYFFSCHFVESNNGCISAYPNDDLVAVDERGLGIAPGRRR